jgi:hypothetical protein
MRKALRFLGLEAPDLPHAEMLQWALKAWDASRVPGLRAISIQ